MVEPGLHGAPGFEDAATEPAAPPRGLRPGPADAARIVAELALSPTGSTVEGGLDEEITESTEARDRARTVPDAMESADRPPPLKVHVRCSCDWVPPTGYNANL